MKRSDDYTPSNDTISYKTDTIRDVAGQIIARVSTTQETHTTTWNTIKTYLAGDAKWIFPSHGHITTMAGPMPDVYYYVRNVLEAHEKRLQASFDLQLSIAHALYEIADQIDTTEELIKNGFQQSTSPSSNGKPEKYN